MNYDSIAKMVHDLVKNPKCMVSSEHVLLPEHNTIIQTIFSKYEVSGDTLTIGIQPLTEWA